jgi:hypothetical protein
MVFCFFKSSYGPHVYVKYPHVSVKSVCISNFYCLYLCRGFMSGLRIGSYLNVNIIIYIYLLLISSHNMMCMVTLFKTASFLESFELTAEVMFCMMRSHVRLV